MRLLDVWTGQFVEKDPKKTEYAILSHTWDQVEQTYQDVREIQQSYGSQGRLRVSSLPAGLARRAGPGARSLIDSASRSGARAYRLLRIGFARLDRHKSHSPDTHTTSPSASTCSSSSGDLDANTSHKTAHRSSVTSIWCDPRLSLKIREACRVAREARYNYLWIDSCCIDKTSSSELSESINSMYQWYGDAAECYAYLVDVPPGEDPRLPKSNFRSSRWFRRGWTLQELIAPSEVKFLSNDWNTIGTKHTLVDVVEDITTIPREALLRLEPLDEFSVAERLSWAARRETTRVEDRAYSLLGIFDINVPTLYGEGERAFRRLQEEIVWRAPDQSLFAWGHVYVALDTREDLAQCRSLQAAIKIDIVCEPEPGERLVDIQYAYSSSGKSLFASQPETSAKGGKIRAVSHTDVIRRLQLPRHLPPTRYSSTPHGIETQLPLVPLTYCLPQCDIQYPEAIPESQWYLAILGCEHTEHPGALLGRVCYIPPSDSDVQYVYCGLMRVCINPAPRKVYRLANLFPLSPATIDRCREHVTLKTVYISHPERASTQSDTRDARRQPHKTINLLLGRKTRRALRSQGYTAELRGPDEGHPTTHWLTLSCDDHTITVEYQHTLGYGGGLLMVEADVKMSRRALDEAGQIKANPSAVKWSDYALWHVSLATKEVAFTLAAEKLTLKLGLDWVAPSHYCLRVDIVTETLPVASGTSAELAQGTRPGVGSRRGSGRAGHQGRGCDQRRRHPSV